MTTTNSKVFSPAKATPDDKYPGQHSTADAHPNESSKPALASAAQSPVAAQAFPQTGLPEKQAVLRKSAQAVTKQHQCSADHAKAGQRERRAKGSCYPAILTQTDMDVDGKRTSSNSGINITAKIKTGQRRVIEFLLSPVQRAGSESLRER